jgi:hypothetical protein
MFEHVSPEFIMTTVSGAFNLMLFITNSRLKAEIAELKVMLYEKFVTKDDLKEFFKK